MGGERRGRWRRCGEGGGSVGGGVYGGEVSGGARVWTHSATWRMRCAWPHPAKYIAGWGPSRLGVGGRLRRGCPRQVPNDGGALPRRHGRPRSGSLKTHPIRSVPSRVGEGRVAEGSGIGDGGRSDSAK